MIETNVRIINRIGQFVPTQVMIPENLAKIANGVNRMCDAGIFEFKPHLKIERDIFTLCVDTTGAKREVINQVKEIAIENGCEVSENSCFHWLNIRNKKEDISKYFEGDD